MYLSISDMIAMIIALSINSILGLREEFDKLYIENHKNYSIPQGCLDCVFYKTECNGICGGCLEGTK